MIEARTFEGEEQFVGRFEGGETTGVRLLLDHVAAASGGREHDAWQPLQTGAEAKHFSCTAPRGVEQQDHEAAFAEFGGGQFSRGEVASSDTGVEEDGDVARIGDQGFLPGQLAGCPSSCIGLIDHAANQTYRDGASCGLSAPAPN